MEKKTTMPTLSPPAAVVVMTLIAVACAAVLAVAYVV